MDLDVVHPKACGLDVHFTAIAACLAWTGPRGGPRYEERGFPTNQAGLQALRAWLLEAGCPVVGMEATGVYWMPVYAALERELTLVVGNPQHMRNLRGQKTDRKDAKWIAGLLRHGLIRPSFVPPPELRDARELTRFRRQLIQARTSIRNEVLRLLAQQGITLAGVLSSAFGMSGLAILKVLAEGRCIQDALAGLIHPRLKGKLGALSLALEAPLREVPRHLLKLQLERLEGVEAKIREVEALVAIQMAPFQPEIARLQVIPGLSTVSIHGILAEIGVDMSHWPTERHLAAWAGVAPGCRESAGKHLPVGTRKGNRHLCALLVESAAAAVKSKTCHLQGVFHRLRARMGFKKAVVAIARRLLVIIYRLLSSGGTYREPEPKPLAPQAKRRAIQKRVADLERLGYRVELTPIPLGPAPGVPLTHRLS